MTHDEFQTQRRENVLRALRESLEEKAHLEQQAEMGAPTEARMIGLERRIATAKAALRSFEPASADPIMSEHFS